MPNAPETPRLFVRTVVSGAAGAIACVQPGGVSEVTGVSEVAGVSELSELSGVGAVTR
jgi:hypothetical protein